MINGNNTKKRYSEKLKDPRWLSKRKEIVSRDGAKCAFCDCREKLNVHHKKYTGEPWEAPGDDLVTVCWFCHSIIEECKRMYRKTGAAILSIEQMEYFAVGDNPCIYRVVLLERNNNHRLIIVYEFKDDDYHIAFWGDVFELFEVVRKFKMIKPNGERPGNTLVLE